MSEDLSSESETRRANTPAWHPLPAGFLVTFSEKATSEGFRAGRSWRPPVQSSLYLICWLCWLFSKCSLAQVKSSRHPVPSYHVHGYTWLSVGLSETCSPLRSCRTSMWLMNVSSLVLGWLYILRTLLHMWLMNYLSVCLLVCSVLKLSG